MSHVSQFYKQADPVDAAYQKAVSNNLRHQSNGDLAKLLLTTLGVGAAARGLTGLAGTIHGNMYSKKPATAGPVITRIPLKTPDDTEEDEDLEMKSAGSWLMDELTGQHAKEKLEIPHYLPAAVLLSGGGLAAGWKGVDYVLDGARRDKEDAKLEQAKKEFQEAIAGPDEYEDQKRASQGTLGPTLDRLYYVMEKVANDQEPTTNLFSHITGPALSLYGLYGATSGLGAAALAYSLTKQRQRHSLFEKAQKRRLAMRSANRPNEIYAIPHVAAPKKKPPVRNKVEVSEDIDDSDDDKDNEQET